MFYLHGLSISQHLRNNAAAILYTLDAGTRSFRGVRNMPAIPRPKACVSCAESKRKCDKQFPECQRCLDRDIDCAYPQPKRRRRDTIPHESQTGQLPTSQDYANLSTLETNLETWDWGDLDTFASDAITPYIPTQSAPVNDPSSRELALESGNNSGKSFPWFLQDETWVLQRGDQEPPLVTDAEMEPFISAVKEMLQTWVKSGWNGFIHRRLYDKGMPTCIQDAFTTVAAYTSQTPAMKETVLQIASDRSSALTSQNLPSVNGAENIRAHLARTQALFIYSFILLFDGSVRLRASAERHLPTLRRWVASMLEAVNQYQEKEGFSNWRPLQWTVDGFDRDFDTASELWKLWFLTESVRRTHIIVSTTANTYQTLSTGWAECTGAVMFTARGGLWQAESAMKWYLLSCKTPPLMVPSVQAGSLIAQYPAKEFDDFAKVFWPFIVGADRMQCWIDKSSIES